MWLKTNCIFAVFIFVTHLFNSATVLGQQQNNVSINSTISQKTGISLTKVEQSTNIVNRYNALIENLKNNKKYTLKEKRKQINALKQAMKVELETILTANELLDFQKAHAVVKQKENNLLTDEKRKAMYAEVQTYLKEAYFPFVKGERLLLEEQFDKTIQQKIRNYKTDVLKRQTTLKEKQQACKSLKKMEQRRCIKTLKALKKENQTQNKICKDWLLTNQNFSSSLQNINQQKVIWKNSITEILSKYYVNIDTADFPLKPDYFLKHASLLNFAFLDVEKLAWLDEDFSTYGKIDFAYSLNGQPFVSYQLENTVNVTIHVISHQMVLEQNINESTLEAGFYKNELSSNLMPGLYFIRLILNGTLADVKKLVIL